MVGWIRIEEGGLLLRRGVGVDGEHDTVTVPEQHRLIEVQEPEGSGVGADLVCHPCNIDDADVMALRAQHERAGLEPQIDDVDRGIVDRLEFGRKLVGEREESWPRAASRR